MMQILLIILTAIFGVTLIIAVGAFIVMLEVLRYRDMQKEGEH